MDRLVVTTLRVNGVALRGAAMDPMGQMAFFGIGLFGQVKIKREIFLPSSRTMYVFMSDPFMWYYFSLQANQTLQIFGYN